MANPNPDEITLSDEDIADAGDYEVAHDPAMAAALGFTSFGAQDDSSRPSKKRRYNPQSDAAVIATTPFTAQKAQQRQRSKPKPKSTPKDEITYSSSDDNDAKNKNDNNKDDDDFDLDTAADLEDPPNPNPTPSLPSTTTTTTPNLSLPARPPSTITTNPANRNTTHNTGNSSNRGDRGGRGGRGGGAGPSNRGGPHNPLWYVDYYDASSNENPWEGMEKFKGLAPVGTWVPRYWDRVASGAVAADTTGGDGVGGGDGDAGYAAGDDAGWDVGLDEPGVGWDEEGAAVPAG